MWKKITLQNKIHKYNECFIAFSIFNVYNVNLSVYLCNEISKHLS